MGQTQNDNQPRFQLGEIEGSILTSLCVWLRDFAIKRVFLNTIMESLPINLFLPFALLLIPS